MLSAIAIMTFIAEHSARSDIHVVNEPAPAISGKTRGTMVELPSGESFLKIVMVNVHVEELQQCLTHEKEHHQQTESKQ